MPKIRAVIFDCYSTIIDIKTDEHKENIYRYLPAYLQYYGMKIDSASLKLSLDQERERCLRATSESYPEAGLEVIFRNILNFQGQGSPFLAESCCKLFRVISREKPQLFSDSLPVLNELKKRLPAGSCFRRSEGFLYVKKAICWDLPPIFVMLLCQPTSVSGSLTPAFSRMALSRDRW